ncbi:MAG: poly(A) [Geobacteraceae bacterium]|nr:MAG: poly(A) [Geobacteraceae bacterium]
MRELCANESFRTIISVAAELDVRVYFVGGALRDLLLGRRGNDLDFALEGAFAEFPRTFAERVAGTFFWLDEERLQARVVKKGKGETATFDFAPLCGANVEEDLCRRDFTINAMAVEVGREDVLIDPLDGGADLRQKIVRACSESSFTDDPLRLLRALRFAAALGFAVEDGTWLKIAQNAHLLEHVAAERVRGELFQILAAPGIGASLVRLHESGLLARIFPQDVLRETSRPHIERQIGCADRIEQISGMLQRYFPEEHRLLAEYLDCEVETGITVLSLVKLAAFLGGAEGPGTAAVVAERIRLGRKVGRMLEQFSSDKKPEFGVLEQRPTKRAKYRFFKDHDPAGPGLVILSLSREVASPQLCEELVTYYFREYGAVGDESLLSGEEIMGIFGIAQGRGVGEAMERLREAERRGLVNNRVEAREFLRKNLLTKGESMS